MSLMQEKDGLEGDAALVSEAKDLSILLVDDDQFMQKAIQRVLSGLGCSNLTTLDDGQQAVSYLSENHVDLIFTDIHMPHLNGLELLQQLRLGMLNAPTDTKVIVLTSYSDVRTMGAAISLDVNAFLTKPFTPETVERAISQTLSEAYLSMRSPEEYKTVSTSLEAQIASQAKAPEKSAVEEVKELTIAHLRPGMRLTQDVLGKNDVLLLAAGFVLSERAINRLRDVGDALYGKVYHVVEDTVE